MIEMHIDRNKANLLTVETWKKMAHQHHHHHHPKTKPLPLQNMKAAQFEIETKSYRLLRFSLLLLLTLSAAISVVKLTISSPSYNSPLVQVQPSNTFLAEPNGDADSFKTHISSTRFNHLQVHQEKGSSESVSCSDFIDGVASPRTANKGVLCCDRSHRRTDVCYMKGDIRTDAQSSSLLLYGDLDGNATTEHIRPYTRKWESGVMSTINEIKLHPMPSSRKMRCSVHHRVPAIVFSTGGYTGNVYHEFNDGMIPLFITAERFKGEVVFVVVEYHSWWKTKYASIVKKLSNYKMVDYSNDPRVHCFSEAIVGLKIHGELTVNPKLMRNGKGIQDFQSLIGRGLADYQPTDQVQPQRPKLAIFIRNKSRVIKNLRDLIKICKTIGFDTQILNPRRTTPLSEIYATLNSSDAMLAVHGAAMTHFLFMRPGSVLIQIVPLGLDWAAEEYYGEPAKKLGLHYVVYKIAPEESSLYRQYDHQDPIIRNPDAITSKGWSETKKIYLEGQNVHINLRKFTRLMATVHTHIFHRRHERI